MRGRPCAPYFSARSMARIACSKSEPVSADTDGKPHASLCSASSGGPSRNGTISSRSRLDRRFGRRRWRRHTAATDSRPNIECACHDQPADATSAARLPRRTAATPPAADVNGTDPASSGAATEHPEAGRGIRRLPRLIRAAPGPDAAAERLIQQPAIHDEIERIVRRVDPYRTEDIVPESCGAVDRIVHFREACIFRGQCDRVSRVVPLPQHERDPARFAWWNVDPDLHGGARVQAGADSSAESLVQQPQRAGDRPIPSDEVRPVTRQGTTVVGLACQNATRSLKSVL